MTRRYHVDAVAQPVETIAFGPATPRARGDPLPRIVVSHPRLAGERPGSYTLRMIALALTFLVTSAPPTVSAPTGSATMTPINDKNYRERVLAPRQGKVVVVNFWASYCMPCLVEIPALQALATEHQKDGVEVVFISSDPPSQAPHALGLLQSRGIRIDSSIVENEDPEPFIKMIDKDWGGEMPFTVVYDRTGQPFKRLSGAQTKADLHAVIVAALALPKPARSK